MLQVVFRTLVKIKSNNIRKPDVVFIGFFIVISSCSSFQSKDDQKVSPDKSRISLNANENHLNFKALFNPYKVSINKREIKLTNWSKRYLNEISKKILDKNELFFISDKEPQVVFVKDTRPFHFSLPGLQIVISTGLLTKYITNQELLLCVLVYEMVRSEKNIYKNKQTVPLGYVTNEDMLLLNRLHAKEKVEIHKWAHYLLARLGVDSDVYLSWIQIQNRNSYDFSWHLGDVNSISEEEALFKSFLIQNIGEQRVQTNNLVGSSKQFYSLLREVNKKLE